MNNPLVLPLDGQSPTMVMFTGVVLAVLGVIGINLLSGGMRLPMFGMAAPPV